VSAKPTRYVDVRPPSGDRGELAIVLHTHMPYVEGFGTWPFGEEWLFEAMASAYLPLVELCERFAEQEERSVLTLGVTPVLADQLVLPDVGERFLRFLRETRAETHRLDIEGLERDGQAEAADALRHSARDYERAAERFELLGGDLCGAFRRLRDQGVLELWTSPATHPILPLVATGAGIRLQVETATCAHRARFDGWGGGFWLPECAYREGLDVELGSLGVRAFCIDQSAAGDDLDQLEPVATPGGPVAVPIDWRTISLVWSDGGYPADHLYRDYHAQSMQGLRPYAIGGGPYRPDAAHERAREHARDFVARVTDRLNRYRAARREPGLLVFALDTELLGHWWYEGPVFLRCLVEEARSAGLSLATLPEALERHEPRARPLIDSSWGLGKDLRTWDSPAIADLVWTARRAELQLTHALAAGTGHPAAAGAAERAARELLALQASDWAFLTTRGLAGPYPRERVRAHAADFERALARLRGHVRDSPPMNRELRGLAPRLRLSPLVGPSSAWGRHPSASGALVPVRPDGDTRT
jgi:1,4-alpha-glucan branching enzyme